MFYEPDKKHHGFPYAPYKSCIVPRPIGWISTMSHDGKVNLAPYSQFNNLGYEPGYLMFSAGGHHDNGRRKDSVVNAEETGEFVFNMATYGLRNAVSITAQILDSSVDEMKAAGLTPAPCRLVKPPRVAESPINIECKYYTTVVLPGLDRKSNHYVVIGRVVGVHIRDDYVTKDGKVDVVKIRPLARLGYLDYTTVDSAFQLEADENMVDTHGMIGGS
jgi:flavin reductase (DIM6/NTAB) family NADH-FMN oxidoreductase RutF